MKVKIIIPTYNEAENLPRLVSALFSLNLPDLEVLVVDDNSPDGTGQVADRLAIETGGKVEVLHRAGKLGLGTAYIQGFIHCLQQDVDAVIQMDADFSHPVEKIPEMVRLIQTCDVGIGSRYVAGGKLDERWPFWRKALSSFGNYYARTILHAPVRDMTGGFRIWKRQTLEAIPLDSVRSNGYVFQVEMIFIALKLGFLIRETPIYFADRRWGKSKMSFQIQMEAALRTWKLLGMYRHLKPLS